MTGVQTCALPIYFTVSLSNIDGKAPTNIKTVFLIFSNKQAGLGPISAELTKTSDGQYSGSGGYLSQPGEWDVKMIVQRNDAYDLNHSFTFDIKKYSLKNDRCLYEIRFLE